MTTATGEHRVLGRPLDSREDPQLLRGEARYVADIDLPGTAHMAILGSDRAHARILSIDTRAAEAMPGVLKVATATDFADVMPLPCIWVPGGVESHFPPHPYGLPGARPVLTGDTVRHVGDPVAVVVAETPRQAAAALAAVQVEYEPLPVVTRADHALEPGAPQLHDAVPGNLNAYWTCGDKDRTDAAIAAAEVTVSLDLVNQRTINSPIEPRGAVGDYDAATGEYTLYASTQGPHNHRFLLAALVLGIPFNKLRVIAPTVGGSFGTKGYLYPDMALVLLLSKALGRPVKWVDTRTGLMNSTVQGRDHRQHVTLAGTRDGRITAVRCTSYANLGAYPSTIGPGVATALMGRSITGMYAVDAAFCEVYAAFTNTVPLGAQRGSGRAEAAFLMERLVDRYAGEIGMDPAEVRRRNLVPAEKFPYDNGLGWTYDSGNYRENFDKALELSGYADMPARKAEARTRGKRLGVGLATYVAICGVGPSTRMSQEGMLGGTWESANIRIHPTGEVTVTIGSASTGQSHRTVFAQVAADELGIDPEQVQVYQGDTLKAPYGQGTYGSRSYSMAAPAVALTARKLKAKLVRAGAVFLGVPEDKVVYADGGVHEVGNPENAKTFSELAMALWYGWGLPPDIEPALDETTHFDPPDFNYPFGTHVAVVEIDELTGETEVVAYTAVDDAGNIGNPRIVQGQIEGSILHGLGQALMEAAVYDTDGRLLTSDLTRYALPRAADAPFYRLDRTVTPTPHNPLGAKGAGEIATVPPAAAVTNAVVDALSDLGVRHIDMPLTPEKVWRRLRGEDQ
ncbi:xanthine dehydrogenase family protein molybdopterin-binding subunit [Streptomyces sp. WAC06614]|uniref:xanthine dehydrogenase family protein molybdopterin-binding subunit n=1 Tax=Streptomyces sp. WAC06614 TaxID=2487416 RepID=UPI000F7AAE9C|nr:xanthine dehydrogenase family protein molybdopterin-binding subunit [Streptomyces sp. WAC06614]RSS81783.1 aldehyde oxidase [Streptomyces sp. WAC06614]